MLNSFYKCTLIISRTNNVKIYLRFRIFNAIFNYLKYLKKTITNYVCSLRKIVIKACNKASIKLVKYYSKIKKLSKTLYNLINILNSTQKLSLYKMWDKKFNNSFVNYETKYKTKFKVYFWRHYNIVTSLRAKAQKTNIVKEIMQYNYIIDFLLTFL